MSATTDDDVTVSAEAERSNAAGTGLTWGRSWRRSSLRCSPEVDREHLGVPGDRRRRSPSTDRSSGRSTTTEDRLRSGDDRALRADRGPARRGRPSRTARGSGTGSGARVDPAEYRPHLRDDIEIKIFRLKWGNDYAMIANPTDLLHYEPGRRRRRPRADGRDPHGEGDRRRTVPGVGRPGARRRGRPREDAPDEQLPHRPVRRRLRVAERRTRSRSDERRRASS